MSLSPECSRNLQIGQNSVELAAEWLIAHPEAAAAGTSAAAAAGNAIHPDDEQLAQQMKSVLMPNADGQSQVTCPCMLPLNKVLNNLIF